MTKLEQFISRLTERTELSESNYGSMVLVERRDLKAVVEMLKVYEQMLHTLEQHPMLDKQALVGYKHELNRLAEGVMG